MTQKEILEIFQKCGALLKGHFQLSSGLHSNKYLQCALVLQHPRYARLLGEELAQKFSSQKIDVVIGPAMGGVIIAYETARALNARALFTERWQGKMVLRRGFKIKERERVLIIEDVLTTGGSAMEVVNLIKEQRGETIGIGAIVDRSSKKVFASEQFFKYDFLFKLSPETFPADDCPLCKQRIPLVKPGSRQSAEISPQSTVNSLQSAETREPIP